jgi:hypothetical protein
VRGNVPLIKARIAKRTTVQADEAAAWDGDLKDSPLTLHHRTKDTGKPPLWPFLSINSCLA